MQDIRERAGTGVASERGMFGAPGDALALRQPLPPAAGPATLRANEFTRRASRAAQLARALRPPALLAGLRSALAVEWERGTAFLLLPVMLSLGALAYFSAASEPALGAVAAGMALLGLLTWLARARLVLHLVLLATLLVVLGMGSAMIETRRAGTRMLGAEVTTRLTGRVALIEHQANGRVRLTLDVIATERPTLRFAPERVRVSARAVPEGLAAGMAVSGLVSLMPPSGPLRPDGYDFSFESYFDGIGASGFFMKGPELAEAPAPDAVTSLAAWIENARAALADRIATRIGGPEGEIAAALVAGVRAGIPEDVNEALRRTGLAHVLSISGLHMALVAATIMGALRLGFALFPGFASRRPVKKYAAAAALAAIAIYLFISGSAVAAERSFIMLAVMLAAVLVDRSALTMRNLAIAAAIVLALSPHEVAGPSFQMSFAATAALIGAYAWWSGRRAQRRGPPPQYGVTIRILRLGLLYAGGLAATSIVAGLATTLYGAWHFQRVSPFSLAANLAAMPVVSVLVMPFAVLAVAAMPFGLDGPFLDVMGFGLSLMLDISAWFSARSPIDAIGTIPIPAVVLGTAALVVATLPATRLRLLALPLVGACVLVLGLRTTPAIFVSEDARLVGLRMAEGNLAVSRTRPNAFTAETWQRAAAAPDIVKPSKEGSAEAGEGAFVCDAGLCTGRHPSGAAIAWAETAEAAKPACTTAALIVVEDATAKNVCGAGDAAILSGRDLARFGSAEISIAMVAGKPAVSVRHAIGEPQRPWHAQRVFSRAARGLPPRRSAIRPAMPADPPQ